MARNSLGCAGGQAEEGRSAWFFVNHNGAAGINPGGFL
jgi:hypothetical protein